MLALKSKTPQTIIGEVVCILNLLPFASFLTLFIELMTTVYFDGMTAKTGNFEILVPVERTPCF